MDIRKAQETDVDEICQFDHVAQHDESRRRFIHDSVSVGIAHVAVVDCMIAGYTVLEHSFFSRGFIAMLYVHSEHRHSGIGTALVRHVEGLCKSDRIFTSTNESNLPMQSLLQKLGYKRSGKVGDLEPGDPEVFYSRQLRG